MRCILNRVLLALSWISIRAAADAQMLLEKQGFSPKLVLAVRDSEIPGGGFPEMLLQKGERFRSQIRARLNAQPLRICVSRIRPSILICYCPAGVTICGGKTSLSNG
jgi:hypothetical protein